MIYRRVIFVCEDNLTSSPMAAAILQNISRIPNLEVLSRGLVVLFPEPYNPKIYGILFKHQMLMPNGTAKALEEKDFASDTLVLAMNREEKQKILTGYKNAENVYTVMEYAGGSGDLMNPYGGDADLYRLFYESMNNWVSQVENTLFQEIQEEEQ